MFDRVAEHVQDAAPQQAWRTVPAALEATLSRLRGQQAIKLRQEKALLAAAHPLLLDVLDLGSLVVLPSKHWARITLHGSRGFDFQSVLRRRNQLQVVSRRTDLSRHRVIKRYLVK